MFFLLKPLSGVGENQSMTRDKKYSLQYACALLVHAIQRNYLMRV
ncbi:hypothetical protein SAMN06296052_1294 [Pontibacter ummariensis]|uniref:Uncharacterized protein n=1 Tax=Pontibacter ummariensis TaxID=1610492 RepID=A0A239KJ91_9BACT|nr:hypothetical protein SAMN06296052_1294 [Pontibacter ummariensis]